MRLCSRALLAETDAHLRLRTLNSCHVELVRSRTKNKGNKTRATNLQSEGEGVGLIKRARRSAWGSLCAAWKRDVVSLRFRRPS